jgi:leucyl aminopeptidase
MPLPQSPPNPSVDLLGPSSDLPDVPLLVVGLFQGEDPLSPLASAMDDRLDGAFQRVRRAGDFRGREEDQALFYPVTAGGPERILFQGLGKRQDGDRETIRKLAGHAVRRAETLGVTSLHLGVPALVEAGGPEEALQAAAEGLVLAAWDFRELRTPGEGEDAPAPLVARCTVALDEPPAEGGTDPEARRRQEVAVRRGHAVAVGENVARALQFRPGNVATPTHLAEVAGQIAAEHDLHLTVLGPREMEEEGMGALLAVAAGSEEEPRLIVLEYRGGPGDQAPLALVGKGLTFDTGGISIKPASGMEDMKYDMSGGAAVLGAMKALALLGLPVNVVGVVPASENHVSGKATRPGDVIRTRAGKTVEVINTDAEGRLILADALSYTVDHLKPAAVVDCATLTGACVVALGHHAAAVLGRDTALVEELREAGDRSGERCWPLPLWSVYRKQLESTVADLKNVGGRPAGTVTAALFLSEFVDPGVPWAHLDIAGTAYGDPRAPYHRKGGHGFPTRLLLEWIRSRGDAGGSAEEGSSGA